MGIGHRNHDYVEPGSPGLANQEDPRNPCPGFQRAEGCNHSNEKHPGEGKNVIGCTEPGCPCEYVFTRHEGVVRGRPKPKL